MWASKMELGSFPCPRCATGKTMQEKFSVEWLSQSSRRGCPCQKTLLATGGRGADGSRLQSQPSPKKGHRGPDDQQEGSSVIVTERNLSSCSEDHDKSECDSEGEHTLCPLQGSPRSSPISGRKPRTAFTEEQLEQLERAFKENHYLGLQDKTDLCKRLNLSDKQVRNWFQNRRMKLKRTLQETISEDYQAIVSSHQWHWPHLQAFGPGFYPGHSLIPAPDGPSSYRVPMSQGHGSPATSMTTPPLFLDAFWMQQCSSLPSLATSSGCIPPAPSFFLSSQAERHSDDNLTDVQYPLMAKR